MEEQVIEFPDCIKDIYGYHIRENGEKTTVLFHGVSEQDKTCVEYWFRLGVALRTIWEQYRVLFVDKVYSYNISDIRIKKQPFRKKYNITLICTMSRIKPTFKNRDVLKASLFLLEEMKKVKSVNRVKKIRIPFEKIQEYSDAFSYIINTGYFYDFFLCGCHVTFSIRDESLYRFQRLIEQTKKGMESCNGNTTKNLCLFPENSLDEHR